MEGGRGKAWRTSDTHNSNIATGSLDEKKNVGIKSCAVGLGRTAVLLDTEGGLLGGWELLATVLYNHPTQTERIVSSIQQNHHGFG